jgi:hypothetical protein
VALKQTRFNDITPIQANTIDALIKLQTITSQNASNGDAKLTAPCASSLDISYKKCDNTVGTEVPCSTSGHTGPEQREINIHKHAFMPLSHVTFEETETLPNHISK